MLSATSDHALRALLVLARRGRATPMRTEEIAEATGAPRNYLGKTLNALVKAGLVTSARGPTGGFTLAVAPGSLSLARIVDCFDEPRAHTRCLLGTGPCDAARPCAAHHRWTALTAARRAPLVTTTLADLLDGDASPHHVILLDRPDDAPAAAAPSSFTTPDRLAAASAA